MEITKAKLKISILPENTEIIKNIIAVRKNPIYMKYDRLICLPWLLG